MAWSKSRDPFAEQNIIDTNILLGPWGKGTPASTKEYNVNFLLRTQAEQETYRALYPSGFISSTSALKTLETTTDLDVDGELVALKTSTLPVAYKLRLGRSYAVVNGWKIRISNAEGTNGYHNDITLSTAPTSSGRTDLVFLEVWVAELGATSASISNTANKPSATTIYKFGNTQYRGVNVTDDISEIDAEVNRRWQVQYRIRTVENVDLDTYSDGIDHTSAVKAWGANPNAAWSGSTSGVGSVYTFSNMATTLNDSGLYRAGDGSNTSKSVLGTVDGYVYAIPICAVFRRNSSIYDVATNPLGCAATGPTGGTIASGISGRPDGMYYDQIAQDDIVSLRHYVVASHHYDRLAGENFDRILRGNLISYFGKGDGVGTATGTRGSKITYAQAISSIDQSGINDFAQFNYQRRIFSDAAVIQQTQFTFTGGATPDNAKPTNVNAPAQPTGTATTGGGSLTSGTYYAVVSYTNSYGETTASVVSSGIVLGSTGFITINSPASDPNATGWNVYISVAGGSGGPYYKQNGSPITIGSSYNQTSAINTAGTQASTLSNTASSTLTFSASSAGLVNGNATVVGVDGAALDSASLLPNSKNCIVYNATTFATVTGTWSGSGTATATFRVTGQWGANDVNNGVVAIVGLSYPAGNGLKYRPDELVYQTVVIGGNTYKYAQLGVTAIAAADDTHLNAPTGVHVDTSGNVYVADTQNHRVVKYNSSFVKQAQFGTTGTAATGLSTTGLNAPASVIADSAGNVYVSDSGNHRIVKLNSSLNYVTSFGTGSSGSTTSTLNTPAQITLDAAEANIYVADSLNKRIVRITTAGMTYAATPVSSLTANVIGVGVDVSGNIYLSQGHAVEKYNSGGSFQYRYGVVATPGSDTFKLNTPTFLKLDSSVNVYVSDNANYRVLKLNPFLVYVGQFGVTGKTSKDNGHLNGTYGISFDTTGLYYIADTNNHRIIKIHPQMGAIDYPIRQYEVLVSGASTSQTNFWYKYTPYQGIIGAQGSTTMSYTLRALSDLKAIVTTAGTAGRNASLDDILNGSITRLPLPQGAFGTTPSTPELEFKFAGTNINFTNHDASALLITGTATFGGQMSTYGTTSDGNGSGSLLTGQVIRVAENTLSAGYPNRGVNTLQRYVENLATNSGWDNLAVTFTNLAGSSDHLTVGYFLAAASGGSATLPLLQGEIVLVVVSFRANSTGTPIYGKTSVALAVDLYRLPNRPLIRY